MKQSPVLPMVSMFAGSWRANKFICVGLDPVLDKIPSFLKNNSSANQAVLNFNKLIIDATHDLVCAYKPNAAYYEALGDEGVKVLASTIEYIKTNYPPVPVILDAKRGDIGQTNQAYATALFDQLQADIVTVHPYFGKESLMPFLERRDKGVIVMAANSNMGAGEFQDLVVADSGLPLYQHIAKQVNDSWNDYGNCGVTVGATQPEKISLVRQVAPDLPLLILGVGAQGGDIARAVKAAVTKAGQGMIISSSRAVLYASPGDDFAVAARQVINQFNEQVSQAILA